ncbi:sigma-70 family RNA polymerase sigma factor [Sphingomonas nostoxanthinifaciens]|uniref:sigma-70 family RNA polymerase sigma factor n=1 Tax=Sphingomonas nostoxanthinifaciens TaxID=2872652 RepID=UPI001CC21A7A|nr:sigma-70 family RNA polymerase sigma factor [Sphingomonas nostoxanthinifaciens]UAK23003.1 sigma-70 family RNA polymerase sigma factor [Sphingomonas nostoxanthinifaciens]
MSDGLKAVFLAEQRMLLRLLTARLRDADAAQDVLQDLWLKLESLPSGPVADPAAYLFRMANNLAFDRRRSEQRRSARDGAWVDVQSDASDFPTAEEALLSRETLGRLQAALDGLPPRTAAIFRAYRFEGTPRKDIAVAEGISVSAVEKHLHRAYKTVQTFVAENGVDIA